MPVACSRIGKCSFCSRRTQGPKICCAAAQTYFGYLCVCVLSSHLIWTAAYTPFGVGSRIRRGGTEKKVGPNKQFFFCLFFQDTKLPLKQGCPFEYMSGPKSLLKLELSVKNLHCQSRRFVRKRPSIFVRRGAGLINLVHMTWMKRGIYILSEPKFIGSFHQASYHARTTTCAW